MVHFLIALLALFTFGAGHACACMPELLEEEVADGVMRQILIHEHHQGGVRSVWLYYPSEMPEAPMSLVVVPPAGGTLITAPSLSEADQPEHIPYVLAGHAVVSFEMRGELGRLATEEEDIEAFIDGRAGVDDAMFAIDRALEHLNIDEDRIYAAGHSSAGNVALLLGVEDKRIDGVIAYAAKMDIEEHFGSDLIDEATANGYPGFRQFIEWSSPIERAEEFTIPIFLFRAKQDPKVEWTNYLYFAGSTAPGISVFNEVVEGSDHYQTMIDFGIPKALQWIDVQEGRLSKKEFLRPRIEAFMKYIEEEKATP